MCHGQSVEINTFKEVAGVRGILEKKKRKQKKNQIYYREKWYVMLKWKSFGWCGYEEQLENKSLNMYVIV